MFIHGLNSFINSGVSGVYINGSNNVVIANGAVVSGGGSSIVASDKMVSRKMVCPESIRQILSAVPFDVEYTEVASVADMGIEVIAPDNIIDYIEVEAEELWLNIRIQNGMNFSCGYDNRPRVFVKGRQVEGFTNTGSGDMVLRGNAVSDSSDSFCLSSVGSGNIDASAYTTSFLVGKVCLDGSGEIIVGPLKGDRISADIHGSGDLTLTNVECKSLSASIGGAGDLDVSGTANRVDLSIYGSGDLSAGGLKAQKGEASITGCGDIQCCVKQLSESCYGSGSIHNWG